MSRKTYEKQPSMFALHPTMHEPKDNVQTDRSTAFGSDRSDVHRSVSPRINGRRLNPEKRLTGNGGAIGKSSYDEEESDDDVRYRLATPSIEEAGKDSAVESSGEDETRKRYERREKIRNPTQSKISNN